MVIGYIQNEFLLRPVHREGLVSHRGGLLCRRGGLLCHRRGPPCTEEAFCVLEDTRHVYLQRPLCRRGGLLCHRGKPFIYGGGLLCRRGGLCVAEKIRCIERRPSVSQRRPSVSQRRPALDTGGNINRLGPHWVESPVLFSNLFYFIL